jgi:hypothetical protein
MCKFCVKKVYNFSERTKNANLFGFKRGNEIGKALLRELNNQISVNFLHNLEIQYAEKVPGIFFAKRFLTIFPGLLTLLLILSYAPASPLQHGIFHFFRKWKNIRTGDYYFIA